jgi:inner membrane protein
MLRLLTVGILALVLQIPISMIGGLNRERQQRRSDAVAEVSGKWGKTQTIVGPALVVPYTHRWEDTAAKISRSETRHATVLPMRLHATGRIATEARSRGIFSIPVYRAEIQLAGEFATPSFTDLGIDPASVAWSRAQLNLGISDPRAIQNAAVVSWNGTSVAFLPGTREFAPMQTGIHAPVDATGPAERIEFTIPLAFNGSLGVYLTPLGESTLVELASNSQNPSFQGAWLPTRRDISTSGFEAGWEIPFLGRNFPQVWTSMGAPTKMIEESRFGVEIVEPVDHYRMAERSVKYAGLFILLTFAAVWLIEVMARVHVHPIQYLLLGAALGLFYLLELSLAEHVGFPIAYSIASVAVIALIGAYSQAILRNRALATSVTCGVAALYGYLYILLMNEDYALLSGSIGLFALLAGVMYVTRNVDWYGLTGSEGAD